MHQRKDRFLGQKFRSGVALGLVLTLLSIPILPEISAAQERNPAVNVHIRTANRISPLAGAEVALQGSQYSGSRSTDGNGFAGFGAIPFGNYNVRISKDGQVYFDGSGLGFRENTPVMAFIVRGSDAPAHWAEFHPSHAVCKAANPQWNCRETIARGKLEYYRSELEGATTPSLPRVNANRSVPFASSSSFPDFNGDGLADFADYLPSTGEFWIHKSYGTRARKVRVAAQSTVNWIGIYEAGIFSGSTNVAKDKPVTRLSGATPGYEYPASNLTDGNGATLAYPGNYQYEYEIDLGREYDIDLIRLHFGSFGFNSPHVYTTSWRIKGVTAQGEVLTLASGGVPNTEVVDVKPMGSFQPFGTNWGYADAAGGPEWRVLVGDFTGDGKADYADRHIGGGFWIHENLGNGLFSKGDWSWATTDGSPEVEVLVGDFNGDRFADILERNVATGALKIRLNPRNGGGAPFQYVSGCCSFKTMIGPDWSLLVGDFNGDGLSDIAEYDKNMNAFWMHLNNGAPNFDFSPLNYGFYIGTQHPSIKIMVGDFTGDGRADVAEILLTNGELWVHANRGNGNFDGYGINWGYANTYRHTPGWLLLGE